MNGNNENTFPLIGGGHLKNFNRNLQRDSAPNSLFIKCATIYFMLSFNQLITPLTAVMLYTSRLMTISERLYCLLSGPCLSPLSPLSLLSTTMKGSSCPWPSETFQCCLIECEERKPGSIDPKENSLFYYIF